MFQSGAGDSAHAGVVGYMGFTFHNLASFDLPKSGGGWRRVLDVVETRGDQGKDQTHMLPSFCVISGFVALGYAGARADALADDCCERIGKELEALGRREDAILHCQLALESSLVEEDTLRG
jgi:hypothetical protein